MARSISFAIGMLAVTVTALPSTNTRRQNETKSMVYDFADITPSLSLDWVDCFESFKCTYLTVPLDYENPDVGTTNVAFIKFPSQNPDASDVLFNPGTKPLHSFPHSSHCLTHLRWPWCIGSSRTNRFRARTFSPHFWPGLQLHIL
jgi:hypothetical protein